MNKKLVLIIMLCICCLMLTFQHEAYAAEINRSYGTKLSPATLSGYQTVNSQYFQVESYWDVKQASLDLVYQSSQLNKEELSSITLYLNGVPFHSFRPASVADIEQQQLNVQLPVEHMIEGTNTISFHANPQTIDEENVYNVCAPIDNTANWLQIEEGTNVSLNYDIIPMKSSIQDFYTHFVGSDTSKLNLHGIVLSKQPQHSELEAAVYALSGMASLSSSNGALIPILEDGDSDISKKQFLIYISLYSKLPDELKSKIGDVELNEQALIKVINTEEKATLLITSNNAELLTKAARLIANNEQVNQMNTAEKFVDADTDVSTAAYNVSKFVTLTESGDKITGPFHQEKSYFISLPGNRSISSSSKIKLDISYAKNLDFNRSLVTILINDQPIGSKKLSEAMANGDQLELTIPQNLDISGNFSITAAFDLEIAELQCTMNQDQTPWAYVHSTSMLQLNTADRTELLFNHYPTPFLNDGGYNQVAVILPEESDTATLRTLSNVFNLLGSFAQINGGNVKFYSDNVNRDELNNKQIIAIGTPQNNKLIAEQNDKLYFKFDSDGTGFVSNEKMSIETEYGKRIGALQLIPSPFSDGFGMLVVTGSSSSYYELASKLISKEDTLWKVYGDAVITDVDGHVAAYRFKEDIQQADHRMEQFLERDDVLTFMIVAAFTLIVALISLFLLVRKYWGKRGGQ